MIDKQVLVFIGCAMLSAGLWADEPVKRHGAVLGDTSPFRIEGGVTVTLQSSSDSRVRDEGLASLDLVGTIPAGDGDWTIYVEGNLSPRDGGIAALIGEANADAGSALDKNGNGRLQLSEIHYSYEFGKNSMTIGLLSPACVVDSSEVANDETSQFISPVFVNNPTIGFPDYALGMCMHIEHDLSRPGYNLLLTSSHGLGDNSGKNYAELLDISEKGKGAFAVGEIYWPGPKGIWRTGIWVNTADHYYLDGSGRTASNYGVYLTTDQKMGDARVNLRAGFANDKVSEARRFVGAVLETSAWGNTLGLGIAKMAHSDELGPGFKDATHAEAYYRYELSDELQITPSLQWINNSGFDNSGVTYDDRLVIIGLRVSHTF